MLQFYRKYALRVPPAVTRLTVYRRLRVGGMTPVWEKLLKTYPITIVLKYFPIQIWSNAITWHTHIIITLTFDGPKCGASCTLKISFFEKVIKNRNPEDIDHESSSVMSLTWKRIKRCVEWHVQTSDVWNFYFSKFRLNIFQHVIFFEKSDEILEFGSCWSWVEFWDVFHVEEDQKIRGMTCLNTWFVKF